MDTLLQDLRFALRTLRNAPGFAAVAVVTLALGIGVNTTVFSLVNSVVLRPFPTVDMRGLVMVRETQPHLDSDGESASYENFRDWEARATAFAGMAAYDGRAVVLTGRGGEPEQLAAGVATADLFQVLGVRPALGRAFLPEEGEPGRGRVAVLTHALWERRFGADPRVVGSTLTLDGVPHTVVGVMPERFGWPDNQLLWVPLDPSREEGRGSRHLHVVGRLREGATVERAQAELSAIAADLARRHPGTNAGFGVRAVDFAEGWSGDVHPVLLILMAAVGFVLLIACANVASLFLARAAARRREIAVRAALGAGRGRLLRQLLTESAVVALAGGALGVVLAFWGRDLILGAFPFTPPLWLTLAIDGRVLLFTLAVSLGTGLLFGLAPALGATRGDLQTPLRDGGRGASAGRGQARLRGALVAGELALAVVLAVGAMLMARSFVALRTADPGFRTEGVLTLRVTASGPRYEAAEARVETFRQVEARVRQAPGVMMAALVSGAPLSGSSATSGVRIEGRAPAPGERLDAEVREISAGYFRALDIPVLRGRAFTADEVDRAAGVVVVSRTMAERFWPGQEAVGRRIDVGGGWLTVIGVVRDVRHVEMRERPAPQMYLPFTARPGNSLTLVVRAAGDPARSAAPVRRAVHAVDPSLPVADVFSMREVVRRSLWQERLFGGMFGAFAMIALVLACTGVYGLMAYSVSRRTHEIGVRMALGAPAGSVLRMVVGQGLAVAALGVGVGLLGAFAVTRVLAGILWGVSPTDPVSFAGIAALLTASALAASWLPARRAARVDPVVALRAE